MESAVQIALTTIPPLGHTIFSSNYGPGQEFPYEYRLVHVDVQPPHPTAVYTNQPRLWWRRTHDGTLWRSRLNGTLLMVPARKRKPAPMFPFEATRPAVVSPNGW